ncbi:MalY/PatB family protein [Megasphaera elsdenii]|uniref:cysteine-S-conjugate beta-lyase n=1 Tax=Megasphaera elsdenii TaxID=907 RepID=A0A269TBN1_MEGEL|nr:aminotransferase class I/II-fold pyridoxal phosphate-dependent enzyme [Megasphaera elsdenii]NMK39621.1 aminotransferase class I/II-fold pyridoxal phosphate-dependent enzyme [Megasphaera elsdenii]PAK18859.1 aminotransferase [Megasphaera elsdenii]
MTYDFDEIIDRKHTNALNTDGFRGYIFHDFEGKKTFPFKDDEFVRMWVADMEFAMCPAIIQAIKDRADKRIIGYSQVFEPEFFQAYNSWCEKMYGWTYPKEEICFSLGIIPALYTLVDLLLGDYDYAIINTPAYGYFQHPIDERHKHAIHNKLKCDAQGNWTIDFDALEKDASNPFAKLLIWCNPQNPTGRVWTEEELRKVAAIVEKHNLWIISDEIHCDLLRQGVKHIPMAKIMPEYKKLITCTSVSKAFNMAGMMFAEIIIRDKGLRDLYIGTTNAYAMNVNPLSIAAHQAAYEHGSEWLDQLKTYLDGNFQFVKDTLDRELPDITFQIPQATYLAWVNMNPYLGDVEDIPDFMANKAGVLLEGGDALFVDNAKGYIRLNLAMPRVIIDKGLQRIVKAVKAHQAE